MKLRTVAHARAGDKGDVSSISVIAYDPEQYTHLLETLTAERVAAHFATLVRGPVRRFELPTVHALNFVLEGALGGGVTRSLARDAHGKTLSAVMLDIDIPETRR
jgi:hypothetical protein